MNFLLNPRFIGKKRRQGDETMGKPAKKLGSRPSRQKRRASSGSALVDNWPTGPMKRASGHGRRRGRGELGTPISRVQPFRWGDLPGGLTGRTRAGSVARIRANDGRVTRHAYARSLRGEVSPAVYPRTCDSRRVFAVSFLLRFSVASRRPGDSIPDLGLTPRPQRPPR